MRAHILVVEDEQHLGLGIKYNLEAEGYRVSLVEDGPAALRMMEHNQNGVDLVILDLMLPGMSGYTVCQTIRGAGMMTPILMLSARTLAEDRTRGFNVGANQYMNKPFDLDELISRVRNLLGTAPRNAASPAEPAPVVDVIEFGAVKVNFQTHEVAVDGQAEHLTPKALKLLRYFVENPERVISRTELLNQVWELSGNVQTRAVDQSIANLRKVVEANPAEPRYLITIRDAGYRFVLEPTDDN
ncbi:MAG: response regulator transcription factor [Planctomycetota bacterium]